MPTLAAGVLQSGPRRSQPGKPARPYRRGEVASARGGFRSDVLYLGWRPRPEQDPGTPPVPPAAAEPQEVTADWVAARRREHARLARPDRVSSGLALAATTAVISTWLAGRLPGGLALLVAAVAVPTAARSGIRIERGRRELARQLRAEEERVATVREVQRAEQAALHQEYGKQLRGWQQRAAAAARRPHWHPVTLPVSVGRLDVAGGTMAGWAALLTTMAVTRLAAGGEVTVVDLTGSGLAADLLAVARHQGWQPQLWRLPEDLPRLHLGADFSPDLLADVLARTVAAAGGQAPAGGRHDPAGDAALLRRLLAVLGEGATLAQLTAGLRALGQIGGPADHLGSAELAAGQLARLGTLAGRGSGPALIERA